MSQVYRPIYHLIGNESDVRQIYQTHLMPMTNQKLYSFMIMIASRRKYFDDLTRSQVILKRSVHSTLIDEEGFVKLIREYELPEGLYQDINGQTIPNNGLVIYLTVEPLNELKAYFDLQTHVNQLIQNSMLHGERHPDNQLTHINLPSIYRSCLHSNPENLFLKFDVDTKEDHLITELREMLDRERIPLHLVVETCNGYHVLIQRSQIPKKANQAIYQFGQKHPEWFSTEKNAMIVIPGTFQGGFLTRIVDWETNFLI